MQELEPLLEEFMDDTGVGIARVEVRMKDVTSHEDPWIRTALDSISIRLTASPLYE